MNPLRTGRGVLQNAIRSVLSVPLFFKIMGIGLLVAAVFGSVTLVQIRASLSQALYQLQEERALAAARSLSTSIERPMTIGDLFTVHQKLHRTKQMFPDVRYAIACSPRGQIASHTFNKAVPLDLTAMLPDLVGEEESFRVLSSREGEIFQVSSPILEGHAGMLVLGVSDRLVDRELSALTRSVLGSLTLCAVIGTGLAFLLTHLLTRPVSHLVAATSQVRQGDFGTRAEVFFADEIGRLAVAFNQMTEGLERYQADVTQRERSRQSVIEKIVQAQEEERRNVSRELHDELGQSLLALLLTVRSPTRGPYIADKVRREIETQIESLVEDVRGLAWGIRPSILDDFGLDSALAQHVEEVSGRSSLSIDYNYSCPPALGRLPRENEVTLYRLAQEALTNVVRHAHATRCSVVVLRRHDEVTLLVKDDGQGFDVDAAMESPKGCLGLTGMRERVALLNGSFTLESSPREGTTIRIRIPQDGA